MRTVILGTVCAVFAFTASATMISTFTSSADLDLSGDYVYAVSLGGTWNNASVDIQNATFVDHRVSGDVTVITTGNAVISPYYETSPDYGTDNALELLMHGLVLAWGTDPSVGVSVDVVAGQQYELQLFFSENSYKTAGARNFDIAVENVTIADEFTPIPAGADWTTAPHTGVWVTHQFIAGDTTLNIDLTPGSSGDPNPYLGAFTLEAIPEPATFGMLASGAIFLLLARRKFARM